LTRQEQFRQRQTERQRERQRQLRNQQVRRYSLFGGGAVVVIVAIVLISVFAFHIGGVGASKSGHTTPLATFPAIGGAAAGAQPIDNMTCDPSQGGAQHLHDYLKIYIDGQQMTVPPGVGIPAGCLYPLHVHNGEPNVIHVETADAKRVFTLGEFFDVWGQPLSATQIGGYKANAQHKLVYEVFDASGKLSTVTSDPRQLALVNHDTIVILYNSPNVHPTPYTNWTAIGD
jgi:hypothetical protein